MTGPEFLGFVGLVLAIVAAALAVCAILGRRLMDRDLAARAIRAAWRLGYRAGLAARDPNDDEDAWW